jgi:hypothetical protein
MGQLVFQATAGGQTALVGPNPSSNFSLNVPAVNGTLVTTGDTGTVTNTMLASNVYTAPGTIGSVTPNTGAFTNLSASSTVSGTGFSNYLASPPAIGGTTPSTGKFTSLTDSGLTSGRVTYAGTGGLLQDSANMTFNGTQLNVNSVLVGTSGYPFIGASGYYVDGGYAAYITGTLQNGFSAITFNTGSSERMRVNYNSPVLCLAGGNITAGGTGIAFPATQNASSDANTLDDYEEGTWTPNQGGGVAVVGTFGSSGTYTKIGRLVTVTGVLTSSTTLTITSGGVFTTNLPFSQLGAPVYYSIGSSTNANNSTTNTILSYNTSLYLNGTALAATSSFIFAITYITST